MDSSKYIEENLRIDKWLWAVRLYKTRSMASDACKKNQVTINGVNVKPSRILKEGEEVIVNKPPIKRTYKVLGLLGKRLSATLVKEFIEDITPPEEIEQLEMMKYVKGIYRDKGEGRPTKKERRDIDKFKSI